MRLIRDGSVKRVLSMLKTWPSMTSTRPAESADGVTDVVSDEDKAKEGKFSQFHAEFGAVLKEGLARTSPTASASPNCCALPAPAATRPASACRTTRRA